MSPTLSTTISQPTSTITFIELVVLVVPVTLVSPQHSSTVATVVLCVTFSNFSRRQTKKFQLSSRTLPVRVLDSVAADVAADALEVGVAVEVEQTVISENSVVVVVLPQPMVVASAGLLHQLTVVDSVVLLQLLRTVVVVHQLMVEVEVAVTVVDLMATHLAAVVAVANLGGRLHSRTSFLPF